MNILYDAPSAFIAHADVLVIGAGACGLCAALAARDAGAEVVVLERDPSPMGTTAMSTGLIPAAGTADQGLHGIDDSAEIFAADIIAKAKGETDANLVQHLAGESAETLSWLIDDHKVPLTLVDGFLYPGHTHRRMYGTPRRTGSELMGALLDAANIAGIDILTDALTEDLYVDSHDRIIGVRIIRPDGSEESVSCDTIVLACCGFAGNPDLVALHIPEIANATFHGHPGNKGHAVAWGKKLGAKLLDMSGYQGHGGLAAGHSIPILWPLIMEGGFQVNTVGQRFSNEAEGYSEQAAKVNAQPGRIAWSVFDRRLYDIMLQFDDFRDAVRAGAIITADTIAALAEAARLPSEVLVQTFDEIAAVRSTGSADSFGRIFAATSELVAPYYAVRVTGALFHTQGGLAVDENGRVLRTNGVPFPNLFAGGGAARGISGPRSSGYLAGNGLLTATTLGRLAGTAAARLRQRF
jgi:fumarate reductase flavoprotein subunit